MTIVRIEHAVPDFERWKQAFDRDPADRKGSGVLRYQILRSADDPRFVMVDLEFATSGQAEAFVRRMESIWAGPGRSVMQGPRARIAERVEDRVV
ncbi:MAG TPA: hypothetical protein VFI79_09925 [Gemmatimonadales bacterium]|nr:hypothetical protein [Gemmatimonadales bacterium]